MEIRVVTGQITDNQNDAIVLHRFEDESNLEGDLQVIDRILEGEISRLINRGEIRGKYKEINTIHTLGKLPSEKVVVSGLGKKSELTIDKIRMATAEGCKALKQSSATITISVITGNEANIGIESASQAITEGALLGAYTFKKHMTNIEDSKDIQRVDIIVKDAERKDIESGIWKGRIMSEAVILARDMVNEPANVMNPTKMAEIAEELAHRYNLGSEILEREEMKNLGMGGLLGVSQGSQQPPKFIILRYKGTNRDEIDVALVGKGITFDSGGISIKPSENMGEMKGDMAGGASVIAAISAIAQFKPEINVAAIIPATENLPSGTAMRPGDIITIMNGKTVEIISTDAEGRLILADSLSYVRKMGAKRIIDIATLTGACHVALGDICTGAFSNNQELVNRVIEAGTQCGECMWQMPMNDEYREQNKSDVADLKNTGGRYGGAITAAWFLREFVDTTPWVHLDIAGTFMIDKNRGYQGKGATGIPVRTLINLLLNLAEK
jgi:leucyl aminopeptidase